MLPPGDCYPGLGPASSSYSSGSIHTEADTEWDYSEDRPHSVKISIKKHILFKISKSSKSFLNSLNIYNI